MVASSAFHSAPYFSQTITNQEYLTFEYINGASFFAKGVSYFTVRCFIEPGPWFNQAHQ